jgi:hypothetical protein
LKACTEVHCGKTFGHYLAAVSRTKNKPMPYRSKIIDRKADELTLTPQAEGRQCYALCAPPVPDATLNLKPEWIRVPAAVRLSGIGRSSIYELIKANRIKSFSIRKRGSQHGSRLISYDSLVDYMETAYQNSLKISAHGESKAQN